MMLLLIIVGLLFASTSGQPTITQLTSGELVTSSLGPNSDEVAAVTTFEYYSIPLPLNIKFAAITFNANPTGSTACGALSLFWSVRSIPCGSKWQVNSTYLVPCREGLDITTQGTNVTYLYNEEPSTIGRNQFEPGTTLYLSVGKDAADYLSSCPYSLNVSITNCGESEVGFLNGYSFDSLDCLPLLTGTFPFSSQLNLGEGGPVVYRFPVGSNVGRIDFQINSTGEIFVMGSYNYPASAGVGHDCDGESSQSGGKWVTSSSCEQPKAGYLYLTIYPYDAIETASIAIDEVVCDDLGGYNCNFYVHNDSYFEEVTRTIPRHQFGSTVAPFDTYYIDLPAGTLMNINYTVCSGNNTLFFVAYRKGGYADAFSGSYRDEGNEKSIGAFNCAQVILRPEDTFLGGLFYIGVQNANTNRNATYVITMASSVVEWTTGSSGSTTGEQTSTTGEQISTTGEQISTTGEQISTTGVSSSTTESSAGVTTTGGQSTTDDQIDSGTSVLHTSILLVTIAILSLSV